MLMNNDKSTHPGNNEIRVGIIGCGMIAANHAMSYANIPGVKLVACCDVDAEKMNAFGDRWNIPDRYSDYRELIARDDLDSVDLCVHNNLHAPLAIAAMRAGHNVYCEKPMAGSYIDAKRMYEVSEETRKLLHIQLGRIYSPQAHAAKELIDSGALGNVYHMRSYGYRRRFRPFMDISSNGFAKEFNTSEWAGHGALYDMGVYHISLMLYLMNNPKVERVSGHLYREVPLDPVNSKLVGFDVEEMGVGLVTFENNLSMDVLETWAIHAGPESFPPNLVVGSKAGLAIKPMADKLGFGVSDALVMYSDIGNYMTNTTFDLVHGEMKRNRLDSITACYNDTVDHWVHALRGHCPLINSKDLALNMVKIANGMALSSEYKREMFAQEIEELSVSNAKRTQETPFGTFHYE